MTLGSPTRMVPIARALADRGHEVAVFNPAPAPSRLIAEAGLTNLPMPARPMPVPAFDLRMVAEGWDVEHFFAGLYTSEEYVRDATAVYVDLIRDYAPDMVVDSFEPIACLAASIAKVPLATRAARKYSSGESRLYVVERRAARGAAERRGALQCGCAGVWIDAGEADCRLDGRRSGIDCGNAGDGSGWQQMLR